KFTARQPMVSSLRRNLQREELDRLIDLTLPGTMFGAASKPVSNLAVAKLREIRGKIKGIMDGDGASKVDPYTSAHLGEAGVRTDKALDAQYIYNPPQNIGPGGFMFFGKEPATSPAGQEER